MTGSNTNRVPPCHNRPERADGWPNNGGRHDRQTEGASAHPQAEPGHPWKAFAACARTENRRDANAKPKEPK